MLLLQNYYMILSCLNHIFSSIDASEIKIQCPKKAEAAVLCYSSYKGGHTLKFLIGISPNGHITFLSKCYGGRVTDCQLTQESGLLNKLETDDEVMADKGKIL